MVKADRARKPPRLGYRSPPCTYSPPCICSCASADKNTTVNAVQWGPHELGAILACASTDGKVSILEFINDGSWDTKIFSAHAIGVNSVSWAPATTPGSLVQTNLPSGPAAQRKFVTGGSDNLVKIWAYK